MNVNISFDFTSFSPLPPIPDEVAGGLSGSSVKINTEGMYDSAFSRELLSIKSTSLLTHFGTRLSFPQRLEEAILVGTAQPTSGERAVFVF